MQYHGIRLQCSAQGYKPQMIILSALEFTKKHISMDNSKLDVIQLHSDCKSKNKESDFGKKSKILRLGTLFSSESS